MSLRIAVVQFAPKIGRVEANIETASRIVAKLEPDSVDLVCLPEMIFSGYVFSDVSHVSPFLEDPQTGPTSRFCSDLAKRLHCYVIAGYPERLAPDEERRPVLDQEPYQTVTDEVGANSAIFYGPTGEFISNYRKTNPFETDMTWSKPGTGFGVHNLPHPLETVVIGICMDLNAQPTAVWTLNGPYEIADFALEKKARILILLNAWLDSGEEPEEPKDWRTLNFWAARLRPLWAKTEEPEEEDDDGDSVSPAGSRDSPGTDTSAQEPETIVVICNRSGQENGKTFAGTSAIFSLRRGSGRPRLLHSMSRTAETVEVWTVQK